MGRHHQRNQGFVLDTCVAIKLCENPNHGGLLTCRIDFGGSTVYLNSQTVLEAERLGYDSSQIRGQVQAALSTDVEFGDITDDIEFDAQYMQVQYPTLHSGDSQILAFARATSSMLVTCDRGLAIAAKESGAQVINPDTLPCEQITRTPKSRWARVVRKALAKPSEVSRKAKTIALKPGQKIVWRSFN